MMSKMCPDQCAQAYGPGYRKAAIEARRDAEDCCEVCGIGDDGAREKYNAPLETHHIKPVKRFSDPSDAHRPSNLKLLCRRCHRHAEFGTVTTEHTPETDLELAIIEVVQSQDQQVSVCGLAKRLDISEDEIRGAAARMVSGGYLRVSVDGSLAPP